MAALTVEIELREATERDRDLLLSWAQDPVIRSAGFSVDPITAEEHAAWFASRLGSRGAARIWIGLDADRPMGVFRVERATDGALVISISVAPDQRGRGRSRPLLEAGLRATRAAFGAVRFRAWIRADNAPSLALFVGAGFEAPSVPPPAGPARGGWRPSSWSSTSARDRGQVFSSSCQVTRSNPSSGPRKPSRRTTSSGNSSP